MSAVVLTEMWHVTATLDQNSSSGCLSIHEIATLAIRALLEWYVPQLVSVVKDEIQVTTLPTPSTATITSSPILGPRMIRLMTVFENVHLNYCNLLNESFD